MNNSTRPLPTLSFCESTLIFCVGVYEAEEEDVDEDEDEVEVEDELEDDERELELELELEDDESEDDDSELDDVDELLNDEGSNSIPIMLYADGGAYPVKSL
jgi:hypothetical protein